MDYLILRYFVSHVVVNFIDKNYWFRFITEYIDGFVKINLGRGWSRKYVIYRFDISVSDEKWVKHYNQSQPYVYSACAPNQPR